MMLIKDISYFLEGIFLYPDHKFKDICQKRTNSTLVLPPDKH